MATAATINGLLATLLTTEGGYVNNPSDPGGETNFGITLAVARANGFQGNMRDMKQSDATRIYEAIYFTKPGYDKVFEVSPGIAAELFDTGVNMGVGTASTFLQRALNGLNRNAKDYPDLTPDGSCGPGTVAALRSFLNVRGHDGESVMLKALNCLQGARYIALEEANHRLEDFTYGWLANRVNLPA